MSAIPIKLQQLLQEMLEITDWDLRADMLIEFGEKFQEVPPHIATRPFSEQSKIPACESDAYAWTIPEGDSVKFYFAVENPQGVSAKAMAVILDETLSGAPLSEICNVDSSIVYDIFGRTISMGKGHGLMSMVSVVKTLAKQRLDSLK